MSREREVLEDMIRERLEMVEINASLIQRLYKTQGVNLAVDRRDELQRENANLVNEICLLQLVGHVADEMEVGE